MFRKLLKQEISEEHLAFYDLTLNFDSLPEEEKRERVALLVEEFLKEGSPQQINISYALRKDLLHKAEMGQLDGAFQPAVKEVYNLMARDNFRRFKLTDDFKDFLSAQLRAYKLSDSVTEKIRELTPEALRTVFDHI